MRHNVKGRKLNRTPAHRRMMFRNLVTSLFEHERIQTTVIKAKEARPLAERLITYAKAGDLNSRRLAARKINDPKVLQKLFADIGPRYADRPGGYTRILRLSGNRKGDNAEMAILELVDNQEKPKRLDSAKRRKARRLLKVEEKAAAAAELAEAAEETAVEEEDVEDVATAPIEEATEEPAAETESVEADETDEEKSK